MLKIAQNVVDKFTAQNFNFDVKEASDGDVIVQFPYKGMISTLLFSGEDGKYLTVIFQIDQVPEGKEMDVLVACNSMNAMFKWLSFYLDKNNVIIAHDDAILDEATAYDETMELMIRAFNIVQQVKPTFMRAIYA